MSTPESRTILFAPWGNNNGHMAHCLALGDAAVRAGHRAIILFQGNPEQRRMIEQSGCEARTYATDLQTPNVWQCWHDQAFLRKSVAADVQLMQTEGVDIVVHDIRLSMPIAAAILGLTCASVCHQPLFVGFFYEKDGVSDLWLSGVENFNSVLNEYGQPPVECDLREIFSRDIVLIGSVPELDPLTPQLPAQQAIYVGALSPSIQGDTQPSRPPIAEPSAGLLFYRTIGLKSDIKSFENRFLSGRSDVLIAAASTATAGRLRSLLPSISAGIQPLWDLESLRNRNFLVVHHGGPGTILGCLAAGLPSLALPGHSPERIMYGSRLHDLGAGDSIPLTADYTTGWFDSVDVSADAPSWESVQDRIDMIKADDRIGLTALDWARKLQSLGPGYAIKVLTERYDGSEVGHE